MLAVCLTSFVAVAQQAGPALSIDAKAGQHAISPDIYGINFYWDTSNPAASAATALRPTVRRWGGNNTSDYNWQLDVWNIDADWFYEVLPGAPTANNSFNSFADQVRTTGGKILATMPILGWLPNANQKMCSFNTAKYGSQCKVTRSSPTGMLAATASYILPLAETQPCRMARLRRILPTSRTTLTTRTRSTTKVSKRSGYKEIGRAHV